MKRIIRHYLIDTSSLWAISQIASGITFGNGVNTLLMAGVGLTLISIFAKPIINLLLLPLNLVTFGIFRWISSAVVLYLVTLIISDFKINFFHFAGLSNKWIDIPVLDFKGILAFIAFSFLLSVLTSFFYWLVK